MEGYPWPPARKGLVIADRESVLATISATALDAVIATTRDDRVVDWSSCAELIFGWSRREVLGRELHSLIVPERDRSRHLAGMTRFSETGLVRILGRRIEVQALRRDGHEVPVELCVMLAPGSGGDTFIAFLRDLSSQKAAERRIAELQSEVVHLSRASAMSTMASILAHELNQPLTAAANFLASARRLKDMPPLDDGTTAWDAVGHAESAIHRAGATVRSIRQLVSDRPAATHDVLISNIIAETIRLAGGSMVVKPVILIGDGADRVFVSRIQIEQVLMNLLKNASEAVSSTHEPSISVATARAGEFVQVTVSDNGSGVRASVAEKLFTTVTSTKVGGMGLGLSVCRTIVEQHGGRIWHSVSDARTCFCFTVPASASE